MSGDAMAMARVNYDDLEMDDQLALLDDRPFTGIVYSERPDGSLEEEGRYLDGLPDGLQERWYADGGIERRAIAVRGRGSSEVREWHRNGQPRSVKRYEDGRLLSAEAWDEAGEPLDPARLDDDTAAG